MCSEKELLSWRSGRQINFQANVERLKLAIKNQDTKFNNKNILVYDHNNNIEGIADLDDSSIIKPKVVFNAIG